MKKRFLAMALTLCMVLALWPAGVWAVSDSGNNDSAEGAQQFTLGDSISGQIAPEHDMDFYQFVLTQSGRVTLDITSYMQWYCMIIYNTFGDRLWYTEKNEYNSTVGFRTDACNVDLESGIYYLKITGYKYADDSYGNATGTYTVRTTFTPANGNEVEPNNNAGEANSVSLGNTIRGLIGANDSYDFYQFRLSTSGRITLDITSYMQWYCMIIYSTSGDRLWYTEKNEYNSTVGFRSDTYNVDLESGVYYLKITGYKYADDSYGNATGTYTIQTTFIPSDANETEPNNSAAEANTVSLGSTIRGLIGVNDRYDFYRFTVTNSGEMTLNITSYMQWYCVTIYDASGDRVWYTEKNEYNSATGFRVDTHTIGMPSGTYYLKVTGYKYADDSYGNATGTYTITLGKKETTVAVTSVAVLPSATILETGKSMSLICDISPANATNTTVTWSSSDHRIATVNDSGVVTAIASGTAVITATTEDGGLTAECIVTVTDKGSDTSKQFKDVPVNAYYANAVNWAVENDITSGTSDTTFSPNMACTRAQAVTFLWRAAGCPAPSSARSSFSDVKSGDWYYNAVLWAVEEGITSGTGNGKFSPNGTCTRAQIVTFLWRYEGRSSTSGSSAFTDVSNSAYYADAVKWAVQNGITTGKTTTTFAPGENCTRAQIVTFLYRDLA